MSTQPDARTKRRAQQALEKIRKMRAEWKSWKGRDPETISLYPRDYLALVECGYIIDGKLSGTMIEAKTAVD